MNILRISLILLFGITFRKFLHVLFRSLTDTFDANWTTEKYIPTLRREYHLLGELVQHDAFLSPLVDDFFVACFAIEDLWRVAKSDSLDGTEVAADYLTALHGDAEHTAYHLHGMQAKIQEAIARISFDTDLIRQAMDKQNPVLLLNGALCSITRLSPFIPSSCSTIHPFPMYFDLLVESFESSTFTLIVCADIIAKDMYNIKERLSIIDHLSSESKNHSMISINMDHPALRLLGQNRDLADRWVSSLQEELYSMREALQELRQLALEALIDEHNGRLMSLVEHVLKGAHYIRSQQEDVARRGMA